MIVNVTERPPTPVFSKPKELAVVVKVFRFCASTEAFVAVTIAPGRTSASVKEPFLPKATASAASDWMFGA